MNSFIVLLIGAAIWGVTLGGAFIGGMAIGRGQVETTPVSSISAPQTRGTEDSNGVSTSAQPTQGEGVQFDQSQQMREQFRRQGGPGEGQGQFGPRPDGQGGRNQFGPGGPPGDSQANPTEEIVEEEPQDTQ